MQNYKLQKDCFKYFWGEQKREGKKRNHMFSKKVFTGILVASPQQVNLTVQI